MCRVAKTGGYLYINAPSSGDYHRYPLDCWRFYPDAGMALSESALRSGQKVVLCESFIALDFDDVWNDFVCIHRKGSSQDLSLAPILNEVDCENIHYGPDGALLRPSGEMQYMRELKKLRRGLRRDPDQSALRDARSVEVLARTPVTGD